MEYIAMSLLIMGGILVLADFFIPSGGIISAVGVALLASYFFTLLGLPWWVIALLFFPIVIASQFVIYKAVAKGGSILEKWIVPDRVKSGVDALPGSTGVMLDDTHARIRGDRWEVVSAAHLKTGDSVRVLAVEEARLRVEKVEAGNTRT